MNTQIKPHLGYLNYYLTNIRNTNSFNWQMLIEKNKYLNNISIGMQELLQDNLMDIHIRCKVANIITLEEALLKGQNLLMEIIKTPKEDERGQGAKPEDDKQSSHKDQIPSDTLLSEIKDNMGSLKYKSNQDIERFLNSNSSEEQREITENPTLTEEQIEQIKNYLKALGYKKYDSDSEYEQAQKEKEEQKKKQKEEKAKKLMTKHWSNDFEDIWYHKKTKEAMLYLDLLNYYLNLDKQEEGEN